MIFLTETARKIRETLASQGFQLHHGHWALEIWQGTTCVARSAWPVGPQGPVDADFCIREKAYRNVYGQVCGQSYVDDKTP